jgi:hypothetical protein
LVVCARCGELCLGGAERSHFGRDLGEATVNGGDELGDVWHAPRVRHTEAAPIFP